MSRKSPFEKAYTYILFIYIGYCLADLIILSFRDSMLSVQNPPARPKTPVNTRAAGPDAYQPITTRNIFSATGEIPPPWAPPKSDPSQKQEQDPIPSQLPLNLIGTLVHSNPEKSMAAIELKGQNKVYAYSLHHEIENLAVIEKIERLKVIFRNNSTGLLEYIEVKILNKKPSFNHPAREGLGGAPAGGDVVAKTGDNQFSLNRKDLLKYTTDLPSLLMQARSAPVRDPVTGEIDGYRLIDFMPNSVYSQLGIPKGAIIRDVDGTKVTSPAVAMGLFDSLKNNNKITVMIDNNGQRSTLTYNIK